MEIKFKAGDVVRLKYQPKCKLFILEATTQTCYAGVEQVFYLGRIFWKKKAYPFSDSDDVQGVTRDYVRFSAIEVEALPVEAVNPEEEKLKKELEEVTKKKDALIAAQDFEEAAKVREEQRKIKKLLDIYLND